MDSNHRLPDVGRESSPLDYGTEHSGGSRGTRTHKQVMLATCFQDRLLIRPDDFLELRELESNQRLRVQSPTSLPTATIPHRGSLKTHRLPLRFGEKDSNLRLLLQRQAAYR